MTYQRINNITGWLVFAIATMVYTLTVEPTASFWDCGEFIAAAYKLQVGHPPGAPFFMLLGRLFAMPFAPDVVPLAVNMLSVLSSSFTILFLFWTITILAKRFADNPEEKGSLIAIMGSGVVGALAYTFSDSFWFSAVEGEVYAMSSLFTALVFWIIAKWSTLKNPENEYRYLILIAYLMGISIGVHLLNLLAIPAICFLYYFTRFKVTKKGLAYTLLVSVLILGFIQAIIIPGTVNLAGKFEKFFINTLALPFNTGLAVYVVSILLIVGGAILYTQKKNWQIANTAAVSIAVILLGYSTFFVILIRANANPPMNENDPSNVFSLLSYLNREQYGDRPLLYGQQWMAPVAETKQGNPVYFKAWVAERNKQTVKTFSDRFFAEQFIAAQNDPKIELKQKYIISDPRKDGKIIYDPEFETLLPRMYSPQNNHVREYKSWTNFKGTPVRTVDPQTGQPTIINKPTFGENIKFLLNFQVDWMYWRYFMWNFSGRQNDTQGHGDLLKGNWLSGVNIIDEQRLASQSNLPESMWSNKGYNRFYLIPFLLGLFGFIYQAIRDPKGWWVTTLLFLLTGLAIVMYLNQTPLQPRERDYAYAGSFYAFAIWIGLSVLAFFNAAKRYSFKQLVNGFGPALAAGVAFYLVEKVAGSGHTTSYTILYGTALIGGAAFVLKALYGSTKNGIITAGVATILAFSAPYLMAKDGWDDHDRSHRRTAVDFAKNYLETVAPGGVIFTNGDNDTFPLWYAQDVEGVRTDVRVCNLSLLNTDWYVNQMYWKVYESEPLPFTFTEEQYRQGTRDVIYFDRNHRLYDSYIDVAQAVRFLQNDKNLRTVGRGQTVAILPSNKFRLKVDKQKVIESGLVAVEDSAKIVDEIRWEINKPYILKSTMMQLDLLANFNWDRPIYFASTAGSEAYFGLDDYIQLEGFAYRLTPVKKDVKEDLFGFGKIATDIMYDNIMDKYVWGNMDSHQLYLDENNLRMTSNIRLQIAALADQLVAEGKNEKAVNVLRKSLDVMPENNVPYGDLMVYIVESLYRAGDIETGDKLAARIFDLAEENAYYFLSLGDEIPALMNDLQRSVVSTSRLSQLTNESYPQSKLGEEFRQRGDAVEAQYFEVMSVIRGVDSRRF
ncbi:MAG: protein O-mannosyl-transferase family [Luteibaculaceae bacterium]